MIDLTLKDIAGLKDCRPVNFDFSGAENKTLPGISIDTRTLEAGQVYWAIIGERLDGHQFVGEAHKKGAVFSVIQDDHLAGLQNTKQPLAVVPDTLEALQELGRKQRLKFDIPVIALTGSNGKTTTKEMIAHILETKLRLHKTRGNLNNHIGCPLTLIGLNDTHQAAVVELGSNHPGEIGLLADLVNPNHALITNIGASHLEFFESKAAVAREKLALFEAIDNRVGTIYKNIDDPFIKEYQPENCSVVRFSLEERADVTGRILSMDARGCAVFRLNDRSDIRLQISGRHNVNNALAAAAVALNLGFSEAEIAEALSSYRPFDQRMQIIEKNGVTFLNDAYNANPDSMKAALKTVAAIEEKTRLFLCLGDMFELGANRLRFHGEILDSALQINPEAILILGESMTAAAQSIKKSGQSKIENFEDHQSLADFLKEKLQPGDLVLIKGSRGMAMEKILTYFEDEMAH